MRGGAEGYEGVRSGGAKGCREALKVQRSAMGAERGKGQKGRGASGAQTCCKSRQASLMSSPDLARTGSCTQRLLRPARLTRPIERA